jgi:hypothetical protein
MKHEQILLTMAILVLGVCIAPASWAEWMASSKFTYQGRLYDSNSPAEGSYDLQFELYESPEEGLRVAGPFNLYGVVIVSGEVSVMVDFGELQADPNMLTGEERWLEVAVRESDPCALDDYITLSPRQELTPVPYAHVAGTDLDWTVEGRYRPRLDRGG